MPELPEAETIARGLHSRMAGQVVRRVRVHRDEVVEPLRPRTFVRRLTGRRIISVGRRAKWIVAELDDGTCIAESVAISGLGSGVGVITGLTGAFAITAVIRQITEAPVYAAFTWGTVLVAGVAAVVVGIVFGTYPARRAAKLSPIDAIRHE